MKKKELKIPLIKDGTVIDHITAGQAVKVLHILGIPERTLDSIVSVVMNVKSKIGKKDIVKVENRELKPEEVNKIALVAPKATINIIRDYEVAKKFKVSLPDEIVGIVRCPNPNCISNSREPVKSRFRVISRDPLRIKCCYCDREPDDIAENII
ncbi:MAG: aspartate carbamoyltransferase regulatory subunit [Thermoplasmata archaeon]|nr:MAG: aspartate carbamoyltransferase regulatory subunit [Thermoplasmata archaeon]HDO69229.1 aspartate carbamoyltransferase regulatory subunit [Thermoplasmatales archaeon]HEX17144.1 aspartate carbamoyltransferase regulatory subunit [Thermoplasmatales archaeon]